MVTKVPDLSSLSSGFRSSNKLNENFAEIKEAFSKTLSRDGSSPNAMLTNLDMNSYRLINLGAPLNSTDAVRLIDIEGLVGGDSGVNDGSLWVHDYDQGDGDGAMWRRAVAASQATGKTIKGLQGTYVLDGTPTLSQGLLGGDSPGTTSIVCVNGTITFAAPPASGRAVLSFTGGASCYLDGVKVDATNVTSNFAVKVEGAGAFNFGFLTVSKKGLRFVGNNESINGIELTVDASQGHGMSGGSATGQSFGYVSGRSRVDRIVSTNTTGSDLNVSALKFVSGFYIGEVIGRWTNWVDNGAAFPTRYAAVRLGNGVSNITVGYVYAEGKYRGVRLTDTDNCWVNHLDFLNLLGPAVLCNRKDQRARASGVLNVTGVGPNRGNKRNDIGVSDKDNELVLGETDIAVGIQEGEDWTAGRITINADNNAPGSGLITGTAGNAVLTNKDTAFVGQDFNCFKDVVVGDLIFTTAGVVLGKVLSKGTKTYWTDAGSTIPQALPAGANNATQTLTLTAGSTATVSGVAYTQRTPDPYFYSSNVGNVNISGTAMSNQGVVAATGQITTSTTSNSVTGVGTLFNSQAIIGKSLFTAANVWVGQIASVDDTTPNTKLLLTKNAEVALTNQAFKIGYAFRNQFDPGDLIFDKLGNYVGTISTVTDDLNATLVNNALVTISNDLYQYGKLYKVRIGLEVAATATSTNVDLDDVLIVGALQQHKVHQPQGIKATPAQTITKAQLATISPVGNVGVWFYVSNMAVPGWVYSNGENWVIARPAGMTSNSATGTISHVYIDVPYKTRLNGVIATDEIVTLSDDGLPNGATYEFAYQSSGTGSRLIKDSGGSTLVTLRPGQACKLTYEKSVPVWRVDWVAAARDSIANITTGVAAPSSTPRNGDLYTRNAGTSPDEVLYVAEPSGWRPWVSGARRITAAAMAALTPSQHNGQSFVVTDVGLKPIEFYCNGTTFIPMTRGECTWANRAPLVAYNGLEVLVTDVGINGGSPWRSNGTRLKRLAPITIASLASATLGAGLGSLTGTTTNTKIPTLVSPMIPGGVMDINDKLEVLQLWDFDTASATTKVGRLYANDGDNLTSPTAIISTTANATTATLTVSNTFQNAGTVSSQLIGITGSMSGGAGLSTAPLNTGTVDTAADVYLVSAATNADIAGRSTLMSLVVELV